MTEPSRWLIPRESHARFHNQNAAFELCSRLVIALGKRVLASLRPGRGFCTGGRAQGSKLRPKKKPSMIHFPSREWKNKMRCQAAGAPSSSSAELYEIVFDLVEVRFSVAEGSETRMSHRKRTDETVQKCGAFELGRRCQFALATFCCMSDRWPLLAIVHIARRGSASGRPVATLPMVTALTTPAAPVPVVVGFHLDADGRIATDLHSRPVCCSGEKPLLVFSSVAPRLEGDREEGKRGPMQPAPCDGLLVRDRDYPSGRLQCSLRFCGLQSHLEERMRKRRVGKLRSNTCRLSLAAQTPIALEKLSFVSVPCPSAPSVVLQLLNSTLTCGLPTR